MEINDKRKFTPEGELKIDDVELSKALRNSEYDRETRSMTPSEKRDFAKIILVDTPRVYSDPAPIKNYVLVRQQAKETIYAGTKFVIPETAQQSPNKGVVVSVGPEVAECAPGDIVTFGRFNAEPIDIDGDTFQLVNSNDLKLVEKVTYATHA